MDALGPDKELEARLLYRTIKQPFGCWEWQGSSIPNGYGNLTYRCKTLYAHRASWMAHNGPIPEGMCVLHKCDNRICINPEHLFLGTYQDNHNDMHKKGRARHRTATILTEEQVWQIRALLYRGIHTQEEIGLQFGVSRSAILNISNRSTWGWL